jgi:cob(I)alamin adenosyltransferase
MKKRPPPEKGYLQVYTGNGKGKTTAALGLAIRAVGAGKRVYIAQFVKGMKVSELISLQRFNPKLRVKQFGLKGFIRKTPTAQDVKAAQKGLLEARGIIAGGRYDLVILDEANIATHFKLFKVEDLLEAIAARPPHVEIVVTGRHADERLIRRADLVTEMREIKHYYAKGVAARAGIEQ